MKRLVALLTLIALPLWASPPAPLERFQFDNIDGGEIVLSDYAGQPILIVNTASRCGFTGQYEGLQALSDRYDAQGLVVLTVPSDDFNQELASDAEVKEFCEVNFGLDLPMTGITPVLGREAHPLYAWLRETHGFAPRWNFNKVLIGRDGTLLATYGSGTRPLSRTLTRAVESALAGS
ncbi:glutathione peroxidase [Primorskyibacter sp. S187A]|uniref:glutathione peroxidase n=1 Tax=Primorskyibacter sp. S187A TaxID=3415130 RepID=UPI003C7B6D6C